MNDAAAIREWFTAQELAGITDLPTTERRVRTRAEREQWRSRRRSVGKGSEYHISALPAAAQTALIKRQQPAPAETRPIRTAKSDTVESLWMRYERAPQSMKDEARRRVEALQLRQRLIDNGVKKTEATEAVFKSCGANRATVLRWAADVKGYQEHDWLAVLLPKYSIGRGEHHTADCHDDAWEFFKADFLRLEQPTIADCYRRLERASSANGWTIPARRTLARWIEERIPKSTRILLRDGEHALMRSYPSLQRSVADLHALQWINGDGYQHNVFVRLPDGRIERMKTWFWQCIYSRKILAYRVDETENSDQIRLAFGDLVEQYGIPEHVTIDNTRAAANKWMTGGVANRYRFKVKDEDPLGLFPLLGIQVHWTSVLNGRGHGQAKPIERAFGVGGFGDAIDKHPAFAGAYTGANPMAKPENYASTAVPLATFIDVLAAEIIAWNERPARRTEICDGRLSFNEAFNASYTQAPIRIASAEQRRLWLLAAEAISVRADGTFSLEAGAQVGGGKNRYSAPELMHLEESQRRIVVRFDRDGLHESVYCYTLDGRFMCQADILDAAGFGDTETSRIHNRARKQFIKATKEAAKAELRMDAIAAAGMLPTPEAEADVAASVARMVIPAQRFEAPRVDEALAEEARTYFDNVVALDARPVSEHQQILQRNDLHEMYEHWLELENRVKGGEAISNDEVNWHRSYRGTPAFNGGKALAELMVAKA